MVRYIGITKEKGEPWYWFDIMLYNRMIKLAPYTKKGKRPTYFWTNQKGFDYQFNTDGVSIYKFSWFIGLKIN